MLLKGYPLLLTLVPTLYPYIPHRQGSLPLDSIWFEDPEQFLETLSTKKKYKYKCTMQLYNKKERDIRILTKQ